MPEYISTGKAARLCGVTPDTVLKWIKKGIVEVIRTAGGHFRVDEESLKPYLLTRKSPLDHQISKTPGAVTYCWNFTESRSGGQLCRECSVLEKRSELCYEDAGTDSDSFCVPSCSDCEFFEYIDSDTTNILVITDRKNLIDTLLSEKSSKLSLRFSCTGYETAALVQDYRPDVIVVDDTMELFRTEDIMRYLAADSRIRGVQLVLGIIDTPAKLATGDKICAWINLPFTMRDLEECTDRLRERFTGYLYRNL